MEVCRPIQTRGARMLALTLASNSSLVAVLPAIRFLCSNRQHVQEETYAPARVSYSIEPSLHLSLRPVLRLSFRVFFLREHVSAPDAPCCGSGDQASES